MILPRYPIYIPTKGRAIKHAPTIRMLQRDGVPFRIVIEAPEIDQYRQLVEADQILVLPFQNHPLALAETRTWIKEHARASGVLRHWQLDDNLYHFFRVWNGGRPRCRAGVAMAVIEDFTDRYENVGVSGPNYEMFTIPGPELPPFFLNVHVYSCSLILNSLPYRWRTKLNDDTDYCLQCLAGGWCTVLVNAFPVKKAPTMTFKGGNTDQFYQGDGRLKMARSLERQWPGVVSVGRRFKRPQHVIRNSWGKFDTPLKRRADVPVNLPPNDYRLVLTNRGN